MCRGRGVRRTLAAGRFTLVLVLCAAVLEASAAQLDDLPELGRFLVINDVHYGWACQLNAGVRVDAGRRRQSSDSDSHNHEDDDVYAGRQAVYGCDSPFTLVDEAIRAAVAVMRGTDEESALSGSRVRSSTKHVSGGLPDFVLLGGDFVKHFEVSEEGALRKLDTVLGLLRNALGPSVPIVPTLGNTDLVPAYTIENVTGTCDHETPRLAHLAHVFAKHGVVQHGTAAYNSFACGGYMRVQVTSQVAVYSLNSIVLAPLHMPSSTDIVDPYGQFAWLERHLQSEPDDRFVIILSHVPPMLRDWGQFVDIGWIPAYSAQYRSIVHKHAPLIKGQLFGHYHRDEFRVFNAPQVESAILILGAVSPIYMQNPTMHVISYSSSNGLENMRVYFRNLSAPASPLHDDIWPELYTTKRDLGMPNLSNAAYQALRYQLFADEALWHKFSGFYVADAPQPVPCDSDCRWRFLCVLAAEDNSDTFNACFAGRPVSPPSTVGPNDAPAEGADRPATNSTLSSQWSTVAALVFLVSLAVGWVSVRRHRRTDQLQQRQPRRGQEGGEESAMWRHGWNAGASILSFARPLARLNYQRVQDATVPHMTSSEVELADVS